MSLDKGSLDLGGSNKLTVSEQDPLTNLSKIKSDLVPCALPDSQLILDSGNQSSNLTFRIYMNMANLFRVRQSGDVPAVQLYKHTPDLPLSLTSVKFSIWRKNISGTFDLVDTRKEILTEYLALANETFGIITLPTAIKGAKVGDYCAIEYGSTEKVNSVHWARNLIADGMRFINTNPLDTAVDVLTTWTGNANPVLMRPLMNPPILNVVSDSWGKASGVTPAVDGWLDILVSDTDWTEHWPDKLAKKLGISYQNMSRGGTSRTIEIVNEMQWRIKDIKANYTIIAIGNNDVAQATSFGTFSSNYSQILQAVKDSNSIPICLLIPPRTENVDSENVLREKFNNEINRLAKTFDAFVINSDYTMGQERPSMPSPNRHDLLASFDSDGIHPTSAGYDALVDLIFRKIEIIETMTFA